jgi:hypothetical protein
MKNIVLIVSAPFLIIWASLLKGLGFYDLSLALLKGNQDVLYISKSFIATFKFRRWWLLNYWGVFLQDFKSPEWAKRYNTWPKK